MPRVHLVTTGGTIASRVDPQTGAAVPAVRAEELIAGVPALGGVAEIAVTELCLESSWNLGPDRIAEVAPSANISASRALGPESAPAAITPRPCSRRPPPGAPYTFRAPVAGLPLAHLR
ncbi:asparaginase domain-containing protein [Sorangium sp. So ce861]|uniref:asparaginase domain-containing protein n=1 Tax=Sorangium sp. So ce861 TaxID=3133323 RepID=UPI003F5F7EE4